MGLFDNSNSNNNNNEDLQKEMRRFHKDLVTTREENERLKEELVAAVGARKAAVQKVRDLEDVLRLKEQLSEDMEKQLDSSQSRSDSLSVELASVQSQLSAIHLEQENFPLSNMDLLHRYTIQSELFELIKETLTCMICFNFYGKDEKERPISLVCGHTYCHACWKIWEDRALEAFKVSNIQGQYTGESCPECRSTSRVKRVRIWALEEVVRIVERGTRDSKILYVPTLPLPPVVVASSSPTKIKMESRGVETEVELLPSDPNRMNVDLGPGEEEEDIDRILRPRNATPYGSSVESSSSTST